MSDIEESQPPSFKLPLYVLVIGLEGVGALTLSTVNTLKELDLVYAPSWVPHTFWELVPPLCIRTSHQIEVIDAMERGLHCLALLNIDEPQAEIQLHELYSMLHSHSLNFQWLSAADPCILTLLRTLGPLDRCPLRLSSSVNTGTPPTNELSIIPLKNRTQLDHWYSSITGVKATLDLMDQPSPRIQFIKDKIPKSLTYPLWGLSGHHLDQLHASGWQSDAPLENLEVVVTRATHQQAALCGPLTRLGATIISAPTIEIVPPPDESILQTAIQSLEQYDWIIFTSTNGVDAFFQALFSLGRDIRALGQAKLAAIGSATARQLRRQGFNVDLTPKRYVAESLIEEMRHLDLRGKKILIPRALVARTILPDQLRAMGAVVCVAPAYQTRAYQLDESVIESLCTAQAHPRILTFTAASTVTHFCEALNETQLAQVIANSVTITIGPIAGERARSFGFNVVAEANPHTIIGLIDALRCYAQDTCRSSFNK